MKREIKRNMDYEKLNIINEFVQKSNNITEEFFIDIFGEDSGDKLSSLYFEKCNKSLNLFWNEMSRHTRNMMILAVMEKL